MMRMRSILTTILKLIVAAALIYWLIDSGRLDFKHLGNFVRNPTVLIANFAVWLFGYLMLGGLRWLFLLRGLELVVSYVQVLRFQLIGFFFNTVMPGAVSGDIIKAIYVIREQKERSKTKAMLTILLDRVVGLVGFFVIAGTALLFCPAEYWAKSGLVKVASFIGLVIAAMVIGLTLVFFPFKEGRDPFIKIFSMKLPGMNMVRQVYEALRSYRSRPSVLVYALLSTLAIHTMGLFYAWYLTYLVNGVWADFATFAVIYPVGLITTAIPLAPGGLGIGHVAFDRLYHMAGLSGGANVFNVVVLGQLSLHLLGAIPYLLYRRREDPSPLEMTEQAQ